MSNALKQLFRVIVVIFALIGVFLVLVIIFVPKNKPSAAQPSLAILAPTVTPTSAPPTPTRKLRPTSTPDLQAIYMARIEPWFRDVLTWSENLAAFYTSSSQDSSVADALEQRSIDLLAELKTIQPSPNHIETHQYIIESMQSCVDAVSYYRDGDVQLSNIYGDTCTIGLTLMLDVLGRN